MKYLLIILIGFLAEQALSKSKVDRPLADIKRIETAVKMYFIANGFYPESLHKVVGPKEYYLPELPVDPWGQPYVYKLSENKKKFKIYTLGLDGASGGEGENRDRGNWDIKRP